METYFAKKEGKPLPKLDAAGPGRRSPEPRYTAGPGSRGALWRSLN